MCTHANPLPVLSVRSFAHFARQCVRVSLDRSKLRNTTSTQDTVGTRMDCRPPYLAIAPAPIVHPLPSGRKSLSLNVLIFSASINHVRPDWEEENAVMPARVLYHTEV